MCPIFGLLHYLPFDIGVLLVTKATLDGPAVELFDGSSVFHTTHRHLELLSTEFAFSNISSKRLLNGSLSNFSGAHTLINMTILRKWSSLHCFLANNDREVGGSAEGVEDYIELFWKFSVLLVLLCFSEHNASFFPLIVTRSQWLVLPQGVSLPKWGELAGRCELSLWLRF